MREQGTASRSFRSLAEAALLNPANLEDEFLKRATALEVPVSQITGGLRLLREIRQGTQSQPPEVAVNAAPPPVPETVVATTEQPAMVSAAQDLSDADLDEAAPAYTARERALKSVAANFVTLATSVEEMRKHLVLPLPGHQDEIVLANAEFTVPDEGRSHKIGWSFLTIDRQWKVIQKAEKTDDVLIYEHGSEVMEQIRFYSTYAGMRVLVTVWLRVVNATMEYKGWHNNGTSTKGDLVKFRAYVDRHKKQQFVQDVV